VCYVDVCVVVEVYVYVVVAIEDDVAVYVHACVYIYVYANVNVYTDDGVDMYTYVDCVRVVGYVDVDDGVDVGGAAGSAGYGVCAYGDKCGYTCVYDGSNVDNYVYVGVGVSVSGYVDGDVDDVGYDYVDVGGDGYADVGVGWGVPASDCAAITGCYGDCFDGGVGVAGRVNDGGDCDVDVGGGDNGCCVGYVVGMLMLTTMPILLCMLMLWCILILIAMMRGCVHLC